MIKGIAPFNGENLTTLLMSIASFLSADIDASNINAVYRLKNKSSWIVVKFDSFDAKLALLSAKKRFTANDINVHNADANEPIFIMNHLSPHFAEIFAVSRTAVVGGKLKSSWITSNGLSVQLPNHSTVNSIASIGHLQSIIDQPSKPSKKRTNEMSSNECNIMSQTGAQRKHKLKR